MCVLGTFFPTRRHWGAFEEGVGINTVIPDQLAFPCPCGF